MTKETDPQDKIDPKDARKYASLVFERLEKEPDKLSKTELRLALKAQDAEGRMLKIRRDMDDLNNQVMQAQARLRSLELQAENEQGRLNGVLEILVDMKFVETVEVPPKKADIPKPDQNPKKGANGAKPNGAKAKTPTPASGKRVGKKQKRGINTKNTPKAATA